jgi:hypothetical protein
MTIALVFDGSKSVLQSPTNPIDLSVPQARRASLRLRRPPRSGQNAAISGDGREFSHGPLLDNMAGEGRHSEDDWKQIQMETDNVRGVPVASVQKCENAADRPLTPSKSHGRCDFEHERQHLRVPHRMSEDARWCPEQRKEQLENEIE